MKIGIDARMIDHPGIGRYISSLIPEVARQARKKDSFVLFGDPLKLRDLAEEPNVRIVPWDAPIYSIREQIEHPYGREDIDLVHFPHFNIPVFYRKKMVVTIHDLIYVLFPESVPSAAAKHYARFMIGKALKNAGSVISVSKHTKDDLVKVYGPSYAGKIRVIYEAADKRFQRVEDEDRIEEVRKKYSLSRDIVLYVGSIKPHKNVKKLIEIYSKVKSWGVPHELVLAGRWDSKEDHLKEAIDDNKDIRYIGE
ncbi:MAG: glycosyltransferase, partial [Candidatus Omnitrophota bacterium]